MVLGEVIVHPDREEVTFLTRDWLTDVARKRGAILSCGTPDVSHPYYNKLTPIGVKTRARGRTAAAKLDMDAPELQDNNDNDKQMKPGNYCPTCNKGPYKVMKKHKCSGN